MIVPSDSVMLQPNYSLHGFAHHVTSHSEVPTETYPACGLVLCMPHALIQDSGSHVDCLLQSPQHQRTLQARGTQDSVLEGMLRGVV